MIKDKDYKLYYGNFEKIKGKGVYLIRNLDNNNLKIGLTNDLKRRLHEIEKSFQFCGSIPNLKIECFIKYQNNESLEQFLHNELQEFNYQNEWFSIENINIILDRLNDFNYSDVKINNKNNSSKERKGHKKKFKKDYYYKYKFGTMYIYIKTKQKTYDTFCDINQMYSEIMDNINKLYVEEDDFGEIINPKSFKPSYDILIAFNDYNTNIIIEYAPMEYISLESYLLSEHKKYMDSKFLKEKENIIKKLNSYSFKTNSIEDLEKLCIDIQKDLNEYIRYKNLQNYKKY
jgi:hypothetical protein